MKEEYVRNAKVVNVVDGDTIDVDVDLGFTIRTKQRVRLARINTHEMNSVDPIHRDLAKRSKGLLEHLVLNLPVVIKTSKTDLYGRYVAEVLVGGVNVSDHMVEVGLAEVYAGGKVT